MDCSFAQQKDRCMITVKLTGGLGNQMFQYAVGRSASFHSGQDFGLDISWFGQNHHNAKRVYSLGEFNIIENFTPFKFQKIRSKLAFLDKSYIKERHIFKFDSKILEIYGNVYLDGYWQNEKYFKDIGQIIRGEFTLKKPLNVKSKKLKEQIEKNNSVSVHIRRGDYIADPKTNQFHGVCSPEYYHEAVKIIIKKINNPFFSYFPTTSNGQR
jgi:hypothetical protein